RAPRLGLRKVLLERGMAQARDAAEEIELEIRDPEARRIELGGLAAGRRRQSELDRCDPLPGRRAVGVDLWHAVRALHVVGGACLVDSEHGDAKVAVVL